MGFLPGALQGSDEGELLLLEELVLLLDLPQGLHHLIHVHLLLDLDGKGEKGSCILEMMQFHVSPELEFVGVVMFTGVPG